MQRNRLIGLTIAAEQRGDRLTIELWHVAGSHSAYLGGISTFELPLAKLPLVVEAVGATLLEEELLTIRRSN